MLDIALLALGVIGLKAGSAHMKRQEAEAKFWQMQREHQCLEETLNKVSLRHAKDTVMNALLESYPTKYPTLCSVPTNTLLRFEVGMSSQYVNMYKLPQKKLDTIADGILEQVGMTLFEFTVWSTNTFNNLDECKYEVYKYQGKYYAVSSISGHAQRRFNMAEWILVPLIPTEAVKRAGEENVLTEYSSVIGYHHHMFIPCDKPVEEFMKEHPKDVYLAKLFEGTEWESGEV